MQRQARTIKLRPALPGGYRPKSLKQTTPASPELMATLGFPTEYATVPRSSPRTTTPPDQNRSIDASRSSSRAAAPHLPRYPDHRVLGRVIEPPTLPSMIQQAKFSLPRPEFILKRPKFVFFLPKITLVRPSLAINTKPFAILGITFVGLACCSALGIGATVAYHRVQQSHELAKTMTQRAAEASSRIAYLEWESQHLNRSLHSLEKQDSRLRNLLAETITTNASPAAIPSNIAGLNIYHSSPASTPGVPPPASPEVLAGIPSLDPTTGGQLTSPYGWRTNPWPEFHRGLDLAQPEGHSVLASADGTVASAGWVGGFGNLVDIDHHNGFHTYYGHLSHINVQVGQHVSRGQVIAAVGQTGEATGPHLHYQIMHNGVAIDPAPFMHGIPASLIAALH